MECDLQSQSLGRIPPSRITDLRVETHFDGPRPDLITLIWTAPGDNLNEGTVGKESFKCFSYSAVTMKYLEEY